ncbi:MAG TPA: Sec-independent protein translocase protein TatB [Dongiaceae bacterium]|nr:Sec-independent protein translocase protein TatB [Dongiaceae bacterium]
MFDLGWDEMAVIAVVALVVLGPKELPNALRTVSGLMRHARKLASEFQNGVNEIIREAELEDAKKAIAALNKDAIGAAIEKHIDADGAIKSALQKPTDETVSPAVISENLTSALASTDTPPEAPVADASGPIEAVPEVNPAVAAFAPGGSATRLPDIAGPEIADTADFGQKLDFEAPADLGTHSTALVEGDLTATPVETGHDEALRQAAASSHTTTAEDRGSEAKSDREKSNIS